MGRIRLNLKTLFLMKKQIIPNWMTWDGLISWAKRHIDCRDDIAISIITMWIEQNIITKQVFGNQPRYFIPEL